MLYVVQVSVTDRDLPNWMNQMRAWLDRKRLEPSSFRLVDTPQTVRVTFNIEAEAEAFAAEFDGRLLPPSTTDAAATHAL
jgi:hypothetical protein